jgi:hypothetical protein
MWGGNTMSFDSVLMTAEERLLDAYLFIRYFDFSDLEAIGVKSELDAS